MNNRLSGMRKALSEFAHQGKSEIMNWNNATAPVTTYDLSQQAGASGR
jgi:hypothetical protein